MALPVSVTGVTGTALFEPVPPAALVPLTTPPLPLPPTYRVPWADLLQKVFAVDVLACPDCGGRLKLIAFVADAGVAGRILDHLGLDSRGPPLARAQAPPEFLDPGPDYDHADPSYAD